MKTYLLVALFFSQMAGAQQIVLADRDLKKPMRTTHAVSKEQLAGRLFPIYRDDLDTLIAVMERFALVMSAEKVHEPSMQQVRVGHSRISFTTVRSGWLNTYLVSVNTLSGSLGASMQVVKQGDNNKKALRKLQLFIEYLKNNRHVLAMEK